MANDTTRSNRLLALDWIERAQAQLVQAGYELQIVGPECADHWRTAKGKIAQARERLDLVDEFIDLALAPLGDELARERDKIVTRRH
jgi:hypothetical protein